MRREPGEIDKIEILGPWSVLMLLLFGFVLGQWLPDTFLEHPVATLQLMSTLPLGSRVVPIADQQLQVQSSQLSWGDYSVVTGYEAIKNLDNKTVLLCRIRTHQGSGPLLAINPRWITRVDRGGT